MAFTPRQHEVAAVVEILESGAFDDEKQMAGALLKRAAQLVQDRDGKEGTGLFTVSLEGAPFGPFYQEADAERWRDDIHEQLGLRGRVLRLWAPTTYSVVEKASGMGTTCSCGHEKEQHVEKRKRTEVRHAECGVWNRRERAWCACSNYERKV